MLISNYYCIERCASSNVIDGLDYLMQINKIFIF